MGNYIIQGVEWGLLLVGIQGKLIPSGDNDPAAVGIL